MGSDKLFHKKKIRKAEELARRKAKKDPYETVWIVCEDSESTPYYFKKLITHLRLNTANVIVVASKGSAPISVVEHAIELARNTSDIDRIACVFDRDDHESYIRAINKLNRHKPMESDKSKPQYMIITSTPCFEIWPLLHFKYSTKSYNSVGKKSAADCLLDDVSKAIPAYTKDSASDWFDDLKDKLDVAVKNAKKLIIHNKKTDSKNPATNMHELVEYLMNLKKN